MPPPPPRAALKQTPTCPLTTRWHGRQGMAGARVLLASGKSGDHLAHNAATNALELRAHCDDECVWAWRSGGVLESGAGLALSANKVAAAPDDNLDEQFGPGASLLVPQSYRLFLDEEDDFDVDGRDVVDGDPARSLERAAKRGTSGAKTGSETKGLHRLVGDVFAARDAPDRLPSEYLAELQGHGWTVLDNVMSSAMLDNLHANIAARRERNAEREAKQKAEQDTQPVRYLGYVVMLSRFALSVSR